LHFNQYGKTFQLRIENADDMQAALQLDESLWVATSAPTSVFRCDPKFIAMLDSDNSGRIHTHEVKNAIRWLLQVLNDTSQMAQRTDKIPLKAINSSDDAGAAILKSAEYILQTLKCEDISAITLEQVRRFIAKQKEQPLNGDGIIIENAAENRSTVQLIKDVIATVGGTPDAGGKTGITAAKLAEFRNEIKARLDWLQLAQQNREKILPFGDQTDSIYRLFRQHEDDIDRFFSLCRTLRFDPQLVNTPAATKPDRAPGEFDIDEYLKRVPLAHPNAALLLPLTEDALNPVFAGWIAELKAKLIEPALGKVGSNLPENDWQKLKAILQPYADYLATEQGAKVAKLPIERLQYYRDDKVYTDALHLIEADKAVADRLKAINEVEKLTLYHRDLLRLTNNFICFSELYTPPVKAMFEEGSVQIDGRWFDLVLRVEDINKHSAIAKAGNIFILYLEVSHAPSKTKYTVAVPATAGTKGNLGVGKRGIFFDVNGNEFDAVVVKVIDNPISLREAMLAPFARLRDFIIGKIESISDSLEKKLQKQTDALFQQSGKPQPAPAAPASNPAGMMVGLSLSAAAVGSAFAFITKTLSGLTGGQLLAGILGAAAVVIVPVSLIAIIKLRGQDLSSLLEGCGWSINARMRFDRSQRRSFTRRVPFPLSASGTPHRSLAKQLAIALAALFIIWGIQHGCRKLQSCPSAADTAAAQSETNTSKP